jgi:hypothetical protein
MKDYKNRFPKAYKKITDFIKQNLPAEMEPEMFIEMFDISIEASPASLFHSLDKLGVFCSVLAKDGKFQGIYKEENQEFDERINADHFAFEKALNDLENE